MITPNSERLSLWRETLVALKKMLRSEWHLVAGFAVLMGVAQFLIFRHFDLNAIVAQYKDNPGALTEDTVAMNKIWSHIGRDFVVQAVLSVAASYVFTVLYLQREATSSPPPLSVENFIYWFGKSCQKYSILFLPVLVLELFAMLPVSAQIPAEQMQKIAVVFLLGWGVYYLFFMLRLSLVTPMAILRRDPVVASSWRMTRGQCWRILLAGVLIRLVLLPVYILPYEAGQLCAQMWGQLSGAAHILWALAQGLWGGLVGATSAVYYCTIYRVFLYEQRNNPLKPRR